MRGSPRLTKRMGGGRLFLFFIKRLHNHICKWQKIWGLSYDRTTSFTFTKVLVFSSKDSALVLGIFKDLHDLYIGSRDFCAVHQLSFPILGWGIFLAVDLVLPFQVPSNIRAKKAPTRVVQPSAVKLSPRRAYENEAIIINYSERT